MFIPKPKNITRFLNNGLTAADTLHTWEYADKARRATPGSAGNISMNQRSRRELNRKTIGAYRTSQLANMASSFRGQISEFSKANRQKIVSQREKADDTPLAKPRSIRQKGMSSDASIYRPKV